MSIEAILLFVGIAIAVAAIALYLIVVATMLRTVSFNVGTVLIGVRAIAAQVEPIGGVMRELVREAQAIEREFDELLEEVEEEEPAPRRSVRAG